MDAFEENLRSFNTTTRGTEMREALYRCFDLIRVEVNDYSKKIQEANSKITELERGGQNGDVSG